MQACQILNKFVALIKQKTFKMTIKEAEQQLKKAIQDVVAEYKNTKHGQRNSGYFLPRMRYARDSGGLLSMIKFLEKNGYKVDISLNIQKVGAEDLEFSGS